MKAKSLALLVVLAGLGAGTGGSVANPLDLFGGVFGVIAAAQAQAAQEAWRAVPEDERTCLERALNAERADLASVIRAGVMPGDPRLGSFAAQCRRFTGAALRRNYACTVVDEDGRSVKSTCNQSYARRGSDGRTYPIPLRQAVDLHFLGSSPTLSDIETDEARQERRERQEGAQRADKVAGLRARIAELQRSPSPVVRAEAVRVLARIDQDASLRTGPSAAALAALERDAQILIRLTEAESVRLSALDQLTAMKVQADARTRGDAPDVLRRRLQALNAEYLALSAPPRAARPPAPPTGLQKPLATGASVGPSFDCAKAITPLPQIVCGSAALRHLDLEMVRSFYILRHLAPERFDELKAEAVELSRRVVATCRVPETGRASADLAKRAVPCITSAYQRQKEVWDRRGAQGAPVGARQESARPAQDHIRLQGELRAVGYLPDDAVADGVYGGVTRKAVAAFQQAEGQIADGFLSDATASRLAVRLGTATPPAAGSSAIAVADPALPQRIAALQERYGAYLADLGGHEREREAQVAEAERERAVRLVLVERDRALQAALLARARERRSLVQKMLDKPIEETLREPLRSFVTDLQQAELSGTKANLERVDLLYAVLRPRVEAAEALAQVTTEKNRFFVEGDPDDIVFLYNASPKAPSVVKGLNGDLVFDRTRTLACILHEPIEDRLVLREMRRKAATFGAPLRFPLARCGADQLQGQDVLVFRRGPLLKQPVAFVTTLASAIDAGLYAPMGILSGAELKAAAQADAIAVTEVESRVETGIPGGYAVLVVGEGSRLVCRVVPSGAEMAHERLLGAHQDRLIDELRGMPTSIGTSAEAAFLSAKRGQCGAVYASAPDLNKMTAGLKRDGLAFRLLPIWVAPEAMAAALQLDSERDVQAQRRQAEEAEAHRREMLAATRGAALSRLAQARARAEELLRTPLPTDVETFLTAFVARVNKVDASSDLSLLGELESEFAGMQGRLDEAGKLARAVTPRSRDIVTGGRGDLVILYNASGTAPSVVRNLRGELVFTDGRAAACVFHPPITDVFLNRQIREKAGALGTRLPFPLPTCEPGALARTDLVILERDRLLREPVDRVVTLMEALNKRTFASLAVLTGGDLADARKGEAARAGEIETAVRARRGEERFGIVALGNASSVVCKVATSDQDAHALVLQRLDERLRDELPAAPILVPSSADGAFVAAKRGQCGAVYADGETLATLVEALERDGIGFRFVPLWVRTEEILAAKSAIGERRRTEAEQEADLRREREDKARLQGLRDGEREKVRSEQQVRLRAQYGAMARAFELSLGQELKDHLHGQPSGFAQKYPRLALGYAELLRDGWEFMTTETSTLDYGTTEYKGRPLETAFANSRIRLRNRLIGEYKNLCFMTGFINDTEFGVERESFGADCEEGKAALVRYKEEQRFMSRWIVP